MSEKSKKRVLIVDDDADIREALGMFLQQEGYAITTASDGFQALTQIGLATPDVIVSDLNMPRMSGHEFLCVVRQRFASIPVIAMSGDYDSSQRFPGGLVADAFFAKGRRHPNELLSTLTTLLQSPPSRQNCNPPASPQTPRYGRDSKGAAFMMLTCGECLRSFKTGLGQSAESETRQATCTFCDAQVLYAGANSKYPGASAAPRTVSPTPRSTVAA